MTLPRSQCLFLLHAFVVSAPWISRHCCPTCSSEWGSSRAAWICLYPWLYLWLQWYLLLWEAHSLLQRCGIPPRKQGQKREKINCGTVRQSLPCSAAECNVGQTPLLTLSSPPLSVWWQCKCLPSEQLPPLIFKLWKAHPRTVWILKLFWWINHLCRSVTQACSVSGGMRRIWLEYRLQGGWQTTCSGVLAFP